MLLPFTILAALLIPLGAGAQTVEFATSVLAFDEPEALRSAQGQSIGTAHAWMEERRPELLKLFREHVYGYAPAGRPQLQIHVDEDDRKALGGLAIRKQLTLGISVRGKQTNVHLLLYLPAARQGRVPVITGLNFAGNQTVDEDPGIALNDVWVEDPGDQSPQASKELRRHKKVQASGQSRGRYHYRWPVREILRHGYGLAVAYYGDIEPDFAGGVTFGVRSLFLDEKQAVTRLDEWGAIGAWAWGLSRIIDYLETDPAVDRQKIAAIGHSRLGKAVVWAAAQDRRIGLVFSNESGMGGISLLRARSGETIEHLNTAFPYWFARNFHQYSGHPERLPVDGHLLAALIAPRLLYIASAEEDRYSNPQAEFLSGVLATPVYRLFQLRGLAADHMPPQGHAIMNDIGYHMRAGKHEMTEFDWEQYLRFADMHWRTQAR